MRYKDISVQMKHCNAAQLHSKRALRKASNAQFVYSASF